MQSLNWLQTEVAYNFVRFCICFLDSSLFQSRVLVVLIYIHLTASEPEVFLCVLVQVSLVDANGNSITSEGKIVGFDPDYDLAVLKVPSADCDLDSIYPGKPLQALTFMLAQRVIILNMYI